MAAARRPRAPRPRVPFTITDQDGNDIEVHQGTVALCRCGRSRRKPVCDGMHKAIGFSAESAPDVAADEASSDASARSSS